MRTPPTNWTTLMAQPHETETRIDINNVSYYGYDGNSGIWSCETRPMLFDKLSVGNCCAATINLVLVNPQTIPTMAKMELYVRLHGSEIESETRYAVDDAGHSGKGMYVVPGEGIYIRFSEYLLKNDDELVFPQDAGKIYMTMENYEEVQAAVKEKFFVFGDSAGDDDVFYYAKNNVTVRTSLDGLDIRPIYSDFTVKQYDTAYTEWVRKGIYYIDTREWDAQHEFLTITGYDAMLKTEQNYFTPSVKIAGWPKTDAAVVSEICTRIGVDLDSRTVLNKGYMVQIPAVSSDGKESDTIREVLGWIGGMYGGNWCMTDEGKLRLVSLVPPPATNNLITEQGDRITFGGVGILVG